MTSKPPMQTAPEHIKGETHRLPAAAEIVAALEPIQPWEQRYRYLLSLAKIAQQQLSVPHEEQFAVAGCEAPVWLKIEQRDGGYYYATDSSSRLIAGLLVVLFAPAQGQQAAVLSQFDFNLWLTRCGLQQQLTPSRSNGLFQIHRHAQQQVEA